MHASEDEKGRRTERILWAALLGAQVIYGVIAAIVSRSRGSIGGRPDILAPILGMIALTTAAASHLLWRRAHPEPGSVESAENQGGAGAATPRPSTIVTWALDESIAIYGLVLSLIGSSASTWLWFIGLALALMLIHRPR